MEIIVILILWAGIVLYFLYRAGQKSKAGHFKCPACGHELKVSPIQFMLAKTTIGNDKILTCRKCGKTNPMKFLSDR